MLPWEEFWPDFIVKEQLDNMIQDLNDLDQATHKQQTIEDICHSVYAKYDFEDEARLKAVREAFLKKIDGISNVHLSTSRVKTVSSILRKIITKRYESYESKSSPYTSLTDETYQDAITDLVGVRVILSYRGDWLDLHKDLVNLFQLKDRSVYSAQLLPHEDNASFMAEWPKVYHAEGDSTIAYEEMGLEIRLHKKGYRSIHYTISFQNTYIELQVRTIYDEAWSDVDHRYVYKQEANPSNEALKELSAMLCQLTNLSNDIGEQMRAVYDGDRMSQVADDGGWLVTNECKDFFVEVTKKLEQCKQSFQVMCDRMIVES